MAWQREHLLGKPPVHRKHEVRPNFLQGTTGLRQGLLQPRLASNSAAQDDSELLIFLPLLFKC